MAKHDENKDLRLVGRICHIDYSNGMITANPGTVIGIRTWGRIDFLSHCGWRFAWISGSKGNKQKVDDDNSKANYRDQKKAAKEHKLKNKNKK